ncbi:Protein ARABIDILLO 1 [Linum perenne]
MSRRVRRKVENHEVVDWTGLPDDTAIQLFSCLNYRDRASLASTCRTWRVLGGSQCLWSSLDLRAHTCDSSMAVSIASRCTNLKKLRFRGVETADAIIHLHARNLREISGDYCRKVTDATLSVIVARHEALESLQLGPDFCERISSDAIRAIAFCCPRLKKLRLSGIRDVSADAINALAKHCPELSDIGFLDCLMVDEAALGNVESVRFLSVAGTSNMKWAVISHLWTRLPKLIGLDVSRTDISPAAVSRLLSSSQTLKVMCALNCSALEEDTTFSVDRHRGKLKDVKSKDKNLEDIMTWLEWILSHTLLRTAESNPLGLDSFWLKQGAAILLRLMQSSQEDVQERAATGLATFVVIDDENASIDCGRAEAVMQDGGIRLLLDLAKSWREGLQSEAAKAIANLSVNANVAKAVAEEGGIEILAGLARSLNKLVAEEAAGGLWNLSVGEEHKAARALANLAAHGDSNTNNAAVGQEAGALEALVQLTRSPHEGVRQEAAGALWNLSFDDRNREAIAVAGGVEALVALAQSCSNASPGLQERAAGALWGLSVSEVNRYACSWLFGHGFWHCTLACCFMSWTI